MPTMLPREAIPRCICPPCYPGRLYPRWYIPTMLPRETIPRVYHRVYTSPPGYTIGCTLAHQGYTSGCTCLSVYLRVYMPLSVPQGVTRLGIPQGETVKNKLEKPLKTGLNLSTPESRN